MPYQVKFDFAQPISPRVVDILYVSPVAIENVRITSNTDVRVTSDGDTRITHEHL